MPAPRRVIVTRAAEEAGRWVSALQQAGLAAIALPLMEIAPVASGALQDALQQARQQWNDYRAVMFVSGNAVVHFFDKNPAFAQVTQALSAIKTRVWAPGPGTVRALLACGLAPDRVDGPAPNAAQFDSEALWQQVAAQIRPGDRVLIVRGSDTPTAPGGHGRHWLAERITAAGAAVEFVAVYERRAPRFTAEQEALARRAATDGSLWLFASSQAVRHLRQWLPDQDWQQARALATHPRIAKAAQAAGFGRAGACLPTLAAVLASIESHP